MGGMHHLGLWIAVVFFLLGCASQQPLHYDKVADLKKLDEYDKSIVVKPVPPEGAPAEEPAPPEKSKKSKKKKKPKKTKKVEVESKVHLPSIEDSEGFVARRPTVDPFRVGEKVVLNLSYFNIVAGN